MFYTSSVTDWTNSNDKLKLDNQIIMDKTTDKFMKYIIIFFKQEINTYYIFL